VPYSRIPTDKI
jgi:intraflagellar transport protein 81